MRVKSGEMGKRGEKFIRGGCGMSKAERRPAERGLTLIELLVGIAVSGVLIIGLVRFFKDSHRAVDSQDQLAERNQNLAYVLKKLSDRLMEAGSALPDSAWPVINISPSCLRIASTRRPRQPSMVSTAATVASKLPL